MRRFPSEFADFLSPRGRRLLERGEPMRESFTAMPGLINSKRATEAAELLERTVGDLLRPMEDPIPEWTISAMQENYSEMLPKVVRVRTLLLASRKSRAWKRAEDIGLISMMRSESMQAFGQALTGRKLRKGWGVQVLCYQHGDSSGPHTDHHPEDDDARDGYVDLHITLCNSSVGHQWLVYAKNGHFSEVVSIAGSGGVTCYRLPFWHYTTPMQGKKGREAEARRWLLLSTFLYARKS